MWVDRNSTLTICISGGLIWNNACFAPVYLWYFCVSMLLLPFDLKSWPLMKRTRDNVLGYVWQAWSWHMLQSFQNALFGYFIQECLSLLDRYFYLPWVIHMSMPSAEPLVTKVWSIAQPMIKRARYSALPISRGDFTPHNSRRTHSSPVRARYGCFFVSSKCDRSFMLEVSCAVCNTVLLYRDISRVYSMFPWLAIFWRYKRRFMRVSAR